ncbi:hypothetical protein HDK77DRAFT_202356 [Phyllosticta capitalensis]
MVFFRCGLVAVHGVAFSTLSLRSSSHISNVMNLQVLHSSRYARWVHGSCTAAAGKFASCTSFDWTHAVFTTGVKVSHFFGRQGPAHFIKPLLSLDAYMEREGRRGPGPAARYFWARQCRTEGGRVLLSYNLSTYPSRWTGRWMGSSRGLLDGSCRRRRLPNLEN